MFNPHKYINFQLLKDFVSNVDDVRLQGLFFMIIKETKLDKVVLISKDQLDKLGFSDMITELAPISEFFGIKEIDKDLQFTWRKKTGRKNGKTQSAVNVSSKLKTYDWPDIIAHFVSLPYKDDFKARDLCDYFHFKVLNGMRIERWTVPNYKRCLSSAEKLLSLYGKDFSVCLIDILFRKYNTLLNKPFESIAWGIGLLSSDKMGWLLEKIFKIYMLENDNRNEEVILLRKPRALWTTEEAQRFLYLLRTRKGATQDGKETEGVEREVVNV